MIGIFSSSGLLSLSPHPLSLPSHQAQGSALVSGDLSPTQSKQLASFILDVKRKLVSSHHGVND